MNFSCRSNNFELAAIFARRVENRADIVKRALIRTFSRVSVSFEDVSLSTPAKMSGFEAISA